MSSPRSFLPLLALLLLLVSFPTEAEARRRGIGVIFNTGEDVKKVADVKREFLEMVVAETTPGVEVGIMYSRFGLFWVDFFRYDTQYVLFDPNSDTVWEVEQEYLAEIADGGLSRPFTVWLPPGLIVLILGGLFFAANYYLKYRDFRASHEARQQSQQAHARTTHKGAQPVPPTEDSDDLYPPLE